MRYKQLLFNLILLLTAIILFFVIGEIFFRIFRGAPNPLENTVQRKRQFLFEPNKPIHGVSTVKGEYDYTARINNYGYRGADFLLPKPEDVLRIFAIGDSFAFGVGAKDDETIPALLENYLRSKSVKTEVVNAGVGHASPVKEYFNLKNIFLKHGPDMAVLFFDLTDLWDDWHSERMAIKDKGGEIVGFNSAFINGKRSWWRTFVNHSAFCKYINDKIVRSFRKIQSIGLREYVDAIRTGKKVKALIANSQMNLPEDKYLEYDGVLMMRGREKKDLIDKQFLRTAGYILKIKRLLNDNNIPFVLVMYPHGIYVDGNQWKDGRLSWGFKAGKTYTDYYAFELMEKFAKENGIAFVNTLPYFLENKKEGEIYYFDYDGHMTPSGYKMVSDSVIEDRVFKGVIKKFMPYLDL
ncbi:MAG: hypothetical protein HQL27_08445 [Candidatus Omnitrophica bacterium]|nr:hypothetical protein [Candidatus Omnitrophota bacterium]